MRGIAQRPGLEGSETLVPARCLSLRSLLHCAQGGLRCPAEPATAAAAGVRCPVSCIGCPVSAASAG